MQPIPERRCTASLRSGDYDDEDDDDNDDDDDESGCHPTNYIRFGQQLVALSCSWRARVVHVYFYFTRFAQLDRRQTIKATAYNR